MRSSNSAKLAFIIGIACLSNSPGNSLAAESPRQKITCSFVEKMDVEVAFDVPAKLGDLPDIDFPYPVKATLFSFHDGNLRLVAMDGDDPSRVRIVILAQSRKGQKTYDGQILVDMGGNSLQLANGPVSCAVGSAAK